MELFQPGNIYRKKLMPLSEGHTPFQRSAVQVSVSLILFGGLLVFLLWMLSRSGDAIGVSWIIVLAVPAIIFGTSLVQFVARIRTRTSLQSAGGPDVYVDEYPVHVGKPFRVEYAWKTKQSAECRKVTVSLILREKAEHGSGTKLRIAYHDAPAAECSIPPEEFRTEGGLGFSREMAVPWNAMHDFSAMHNWIFWLLRVKADLPGRPDLQQDFELQVNPSPGR
jgi:hypothetical protein